MSESEEPRRKGHLSWGPGDVTFVPSGSKAVKEAAHHELGLPLLSAMFIERIRRRNKIRLVPYDPERWFSGALSTLRLFHTGTPLTAGEKKQSLDLIIEFAANTHSEFDVALGSLLSELSKRAGLTLGHAQKLVSIFLKYAFVTCHSGQDRSWDGIVEAHGHEFPVPIDREVLKLLYPRPDIVVVKGSQVKPYRVAVRETSGAEVPWTKLTQPETYWSLQAIIRLRSAAEGMLPLGYEMRKLWVA